MKRMYRICLAAVLLLVWLAMPAQAEENLFERLQPMLDAAAVDALGAGEPAYAGIRPMAAEMSPEGDAVVVLGDVYRADGPLDTLTPEAYGSVVWLDQRAVVQLQRDDAEATGWKLTSFTLDAELLMEDAAQAYFDEAMHSFVSEELGFAVQYPSIFGSGEPTENGMHALLEDGTAAFLTERVANAGKLSLDDVVSSETARHDDAWLTRNEANGTARLTWTENGVITADVYLVTNEWIYHAQLRWAESRNADFAVYSEYMMNSFCVEELGMG